MTAPPFNLETAVGWFSLTVVDERRIIATAPARGIALLMMNDDQLTIRVELQPDQDGAWRPLQPDDVLVVRRGGHGARRESVPDQRLREMVVDALSAAVTAWAMDCPILLATAAAFNRDATTHRSHRVTIEQITIKD